MLTLILSLSLYCFWDQSLFTAGEKGRGGGEGGGAKGFDCCRDHIVSMGNEGGDNSSVTEYEGTIVKN